MKQSHHRSVLVAALLVVAWSLHVVAPSAVAQKVWDGGGDGVNWSDNANWAGDTQPGASEIVQFDDTAGAGSTNVVDNAPRTIGGLRIRNTSGQHAINLNGGTVSFDANGREFYVARFDNNSRLHMYNGTINVLTNADFRVGQDSGRTGTLTFGSGTTLLSDRMTFFVVGLNGTGHVDLSAASGTLSVRANGFRVAIGDGDSGNGTVLLGSNINALFGTGDSERPEMRVGMQDGGSGGTASGTLIKTGGNFDAYLSQLRVGDNGPGAGSATGLINLTGTTSGTFSISGSAAWIGRGFNGTGTVHLGSGVVASIGLPSNTTNLRLGEGHNGGNPNGTVTKTGGEFNANLNQWWVAYNGSGSGSATGLMDLSGTTSGVISNFGEMFIGVRNDATGTVLLGGTTDKMGTTAARADVRIADTQGTSGSLSAGTLTKSGGSFEGAFNVWRVGVNDNTGGNSANGTMDLSGTTFTASGINSSGELRVGIGRDATGLVRLPSGNVSVPNLHVGDSNTGGEAGGSGTLDLRGTTFTISGTGSINTSGNLMGRGTLSASTFTMNGRTTATNGTLTLSYTTFNNTVENPTSGGAGWRAINGGRLDLPLVAVSAGNQTRNWGESSGDATIDLVNSVRASFTGATAGDWQVSLLAPDNVAAQPGLANVIGLWDINAINGLTFSSVDLTFRYDLELATTLGVNESDLKLFRHDGSEWQLLTGFTVDTVNKFVQYNGATAFSQWAIATDFAPVGLIPEPSTVLLLMAGGALLWARRRK